MKTTNYFKKFLRIAPFSLAFWRTLEAKAIMDTIPPKTKQKKGDFPQFDHPILDLGCGFGEFTSIFFDQAIDVGIDISLHDIEKAAKKRHYKRVLVEDARAMHFPDNMFKTVFSLSVLEHIPDTQKALHEAHRILRKNGMFICTVPTKDIEKYLVVARFFKKLGMPLCADLYIRLFHAFFKHEIIVPPKQWKKWMHEAGFKKVSIYPIQSASAVALFEVTLPFSFPSYIWRILTGKRLAVRFPFLTPFWVRLYRWVERGEPTYSCALIVSQK